MPEAGQYITVGKFGRPRGLHGEIYITPFTDLTGRIESIPTLFFRDGVHWRSLPVVRAQIVSNRPVVRLEGIDSPEAAAVLTNRAVAVPVESLPKLDDGSHYVHELIGATVIDEATGEPVGELVEIEHYPANDVYLIERQGGKLQVCAAVREFVVAIDPTAREITIRMDGLIDAT